MSGKKEKTQAGAKKRAAAAPTVAALAREIGRDRGTVSRWTRREDWKFGRPPFDAKTVEKVAAWAKTLAPNPAEPIDELEMPSPTDRRDERAAKLKILRERGWKLQLERKELEGVLIEKGEVEAGRLARIAAVMKAMKQAGVRLSVGLAGVTEPPAIERIVEAEMRRICNAFASEEGGGG